MCHGVAGNAYTFLQLYRLTQDHVHLYRAVKFAEWCMSSEERQCPPPDRSYSLFEGEESMSALPSDPLLVLHTGLAGVTYFYCDLLTPEKATYPALELLIP